MIPGLTVITPPSFEPVLLADMRMHLRMDADLTDEDTLIETLISAGREWIENYTGRTLCETVLEASFPGYPDWYIDLPRPPIIGVESFKYRTADGTDTTLASDQYTVNTSVAYFPRIVPAYGVTWPGTRWQANSLRVRYTAGYARAGSPDERSLIPASLRSALKLIVGHLFEHREAAIDQLKVEELPLGVKWLCSPYRVEGLGA